ncbi:MAG TPA: glycosyltransferase family 4 protein, partial [Vicinamibacterales bacterium]|nr:glycosyltransferase family 4 protein [Vicinamibacterales bacterium]
MPRPIHICHVFSSFDPGGPEVRAAALMNLLGRRFRHTIIAADGRYGAADRIEPGVAARLVEPPPGKGSLFYGLKMLPLLTSLAPDLVATYNWGAIDAVIASSLARAWPVIHSEDGFGVDEIPALKRRRVLARRVLLPRAYATLVPSATLLRIAVEQYRIPPDRVVFVPNGVDLDAFRPGRSSAWRRAAGIPEHTVVIGTVGALRPEKNLGFLLKAFARAALFDCVLLVVGDGPCRAELEAQAHRLGLASRVIFTGSTRR